MELRQNLALRKLLVPELTQSLNILSLPLLELKTLAEQELVSNPFLEESPPSPSYTYPKSQIWTRERPPLEIIAKKDSLQDLLLRQLGMFSNGDEEFKIGQEIIDNIDDNGYLQATLEEIANHLNLPIERVENVLKLIQQFEPAGVGARTVSECLLIQLDLANEKDPLLRKVVESHLEDVAKKNFSRIAKQLKVSKEVIKPITQKILKLDPKPGRNYSQEESWRIIPDVIVEDNDEDTLEAYLNDENLPHLSINREYKNLLKENNLDAQTKSYLKERFLNALELLRSISKRQRTLKRVADCVVEIQQEAIREELSNLKPLTFNEVAQRLGIHESTVCRAVMNKYVKLPYCVVALKALFPSHVHSKDGQAVSCNFVKKRIKEYIAGEDKKHPLSDQEITRLFFEKENLNLSRRTVSKYREELKILSSPFRRER